MIIGITGFIGSGKGTVAELLVRDYGFRQDSFAASLKDACACLFGWPRYLLEGDTVESRHWREQPDSWWATKLGIENFSPRLALQLMGTDVLRNHFNQDIWFLTLENRLRKDPDTPVVISDVRFPNEVAFVKRLGGTIINVSRGDHPEWYDVAISANSGNPESADLMKTRYSSAHYSEWAWVGTEMDRVLNNNGTIEFLAEQVNNLIREIR